MTPHIALVTGATGYIGGNLARRLVREGCEVHIICRAGSNRNFLRDMPRTIRIHEHDGTTARLVQILALSKPGVVYHLASMFVAEHSVDHISALVNSNILFGTQLVEAMVVQGASRLVNTGTAWQHYNDREYSPVCLYAATKEAFESILTYYIEARNLAVITLKLFDTYGPGDWRPKLFALLRRLRDEGQPVAMTSGEQEMDLVYIDDVVDAFVLAGERLLSEKITTHERYGVASGRPVKLKEVVRMFGDAIGTPLPVIWGGRPHREREVMRPWGASVPIPGWSPRVSLEKGIRLVLEGISKK